MTQLTAIPATHAPATHAPAVPDSAATKDLDGDRGTGRSWIWALVEALANAGAAFDPAAAQAARRWARLRDEELGVGRR